MMELMQIGDGAAFVDMKSTVSEHKLKQQITCVVKMHIRIFYSTQHILFNCFVGQTCPAECFAKLRVPLRDKISL